MNVDFMSEADRQVWREKERAAASWELTFFEIVALPETTDCPQEELLP